MNQVKFVNDIMKKLTICFCFYIKSCTFVRDNF